MTDAAIFQARRAQQCAVDPDGELQVLRVKSVVGKISDQMSAKPRVKVDGMPAGVRQ